MTYSHMPSNVASPALSSTGEGPDARDLPLGGARGDELERDDQAGEEGDETPGERDGEKLADDGVVVHELFQRGAGGAGLELLVRDVLGRLR